jgi:hypothetical protein
MEWGVIPDGHIEKMTGSDARRIVIVILGSGRRNLD